MAVSILHRVSGDGLAIFGAAGLVWWLVAAAMGPEAYASFVYYVWSADPADAVGGVINIFAKIILVGLTWAFFQHLFSGLRHFVLDMGAGYELQTNKTWSLAIPALSIIVTAALWLWILAEKL